MSIKAAIAGTGFMAMAHAEGLRRAGIEIAGIVGSTPEKSRAAAGRLGIARAYDSFEALIADGGVDAVHVTTPNHLHFPMAKAALEAGKHVMCEKPLAMNSEESQALVTLAKKAGTVAAVNYNLRFYPLCLEARARVASGALGPIHGVVGRYVQDWLLEPTDYNWRVRADVGGRLRAVADIGTHFLDLVQAICGLDIVEICADLSTVHATRSKPRGEVQTFSGKLGGPESQDDREDVQVDTEDQGAILLRFSGGARGVLWVSQMTAGRKNHLAFELSGRKAAMAWNSEAPEALWLGHRDRANETLMRDPALLGEGAAAHTAYPGGHSEGYPDTFKQAFRAFYAQVQAGTPLAPGSALADFSDGHREIRLCEAVSESHERRAWVEVKK